MQIESDGLNLNSIGCIYCRPVSVLTSVDILVSFTDDPWLASDGDTCRKSDMCYKCSCHSVLTYCAHCWSCCRHWCDAGTQTDGLMESLCGCGLLLSGCVLWASVWCVFQSRPPVRELLIPTVNVISQSRAAFNTPVHQPSVTPASSSAQQTRCTPQDRWRCHVMCCHHRTDKVHTTGPVTLSCDVLSSSYYRWRCHVMCCHHCTDKVHTTGPVTLSCDVLSSLYSHVIVQVQHWMPVSESLSLWLTISFSEM